jgi:tetratricopeptide (TPR) repeat protein
MLADVLARAGALLEIGRAADARALLATMLAAGIEDPRLWNLDAAAARATGQFDDALRSAERGVALAPAWAPVVGELALILAVARRHRDAARHAQRVIELAPEDPWSWIVASEVARRAGRRAEAVAAADRLIDLDPQSAQSWEVAARAADLARDRTGAEERLRRALSIEPTRATSLRLLAGLVGRRRYRIPEAVTLYGRALAIVPGDDASVRRAADLITSWRATWCVATSAVAAAVLLVLAQASVPFVGEGTVAWVGLVVITAVLVGFVVGADRMAVARLDPVAFRAVREQRRAEVRRRRGPAVRRCIGRT